MTEEYIVTSDFSLILAHLTLTVETTSSFEMQKMWYRVNISLMWSAKVGNAL